MAIKEKDVLADKEFSIIQEIAKNSSVTQRELSQSTGLSLGMTNILLKRLVRKGYVKVTHLDWKRTQYLLTVKGLFEKTRKSYAYALYAIQQFRLIRKRIHDLVTQEYQGGLRSAVIVAWPETAEMIRAALSELTLPGLAVTFVETFEQLDGRAGLVFTATVEPQPGPGPGQRFIPLLEVDALKFRFPAETGAPG